MGYSFQPRDISSAAQETGRCLPQLALPSWLLGVTIHDGSQPKFKLLLKAGAAPDIIVDGMEFSPLQLAVHK